MNRPVQRTADIIARGRAICGACGEEKPLSAFYGPCDTRPGYNVSQCRACKAERQRKRLGAGGRIGIQNTCKACKNERARAAHAGSLKTCRHCKKKKPIREFVGEGDQVAGKYCLDCRAAHATTRSRPCCQCGVIISRVRLLGKPYPKLPKWCSDDCRSIWDAGEKTCRTCGCRQTLAEFYKPTSTICKTCERPKRRLASRAAYEKERIIVQDFCGYCRGPVLRFTNVVSALRKPKHRCFCSEACAHRGNLARVRELRAIDPTKDRERERKLREKNRDRIYAQVRMRRAAGKMIGQDKRRREKDRATRAIYTAAFELGLVPPHAHKRAAAAKTPEEKITVTRARDKRKRDRRRATVAALRELGLLTEEKGQ